MESVEEIIKALRCTSSVYDGRSCENCPYRVLEEVKPGINIPEDIVLEGNKYWQSCDCDRIEIEAADVLEAFLKNMEDE